jgi:hypothetical protein
MRLVHEAEGNSVVGPIFLGQLGPKRYKVVIGDARLSNDIPVPAGVVVARKNVSSGCNRMNWRTYMSIRHISAPAFKHPCTN